MDKINSQQLSEHKDNNLENEWPKFTKEWDKVIVKYNDKDKKYFQDGNRFNGTLSYEKIFGEEFALIETKQFVGILRLPSSEEKRLVINPKIASNYLRLIEYAQKVKCNVDKRFFFYDKMYRVNVKEGDVFLEIIVVLFLEELKKVFRRGLFRDYVRKEENSRFLKGKLIVSRHLKKNFINPKFYCRYFDLTVDNFENQVVLYAAYVATKLVPQKSELKQNVYKYFNLLKDEITLKDFILPNELSGLRVSRRNQHYSEILELSKIIIEKNFYSSKLEKNTKCCNFLVDMNVVFERFVFGLLDEISKSKKWKVRDQTHYLTKNFVEMPKGNMKLIPDITVLEEGKEEIAVVDVKYMADIGNVQYYQLIVYALALSLKEEKFRKAIFIHFSKDNLSACSLSGKIKLSEFSDKNHDLDIHVINITLGEALEEAYIERIRKQLKENLKNIGL